MSEGPRFIHKCPISFCKCIEIAVFTSNDQYDLPVCWQGVFLSRESWLLHNGRADQEAVSTPQ